jgi:hypothetical protein
MDESLDAEKDWAELRPLILEEVGDQVRLVFADWEWLESRIPGNLVDGYYLNGSSLEGLIKAVRWEAGLEPESDFIEYNSEGDVCLVEFEDASEAKITASLTWEMLHDVERVRHAVRVAREHDWDD